MLDRTSTNPDFLIGYAVGRLIGKGIKYTGMAWGVKVIAIPAATKYVAPVVRYSVPVIKTIASNHKRMGYVHPCDYDLWMHF